MEDLEKMKILVEKINKFAKEYYSSDVETIDNDTYDKLYDELVELEKSTGIVLTNSPTINVGGEVIEGFEKVIHEHPLKSLAKTKDIEEFRKFAYRYDSILMWKIDGLTVDLIYENGELINGSTRGNGIVGEDITHNVKTFSNIPLKINYKKKIHIIGEAYIDFDTFEKINKKMPLDRKYKNPRNLVSGTVKQLDSSICKSRQVKFIGYILEDSDLHTKEEQIEFIKKMGFQSIEYIKLDKNNNDIEEYIEKLKNSAKEKQIPIDGLVNMYNDINIGTLLGSTEHHPLHSLAFKFNDEVEITKLIKVDYQVGRTGRITPVACFEPVELEGTTVRKASIHNLSILKSLKLGIGDEISVYKANQIIPQIKDNLTQSNTLNIITKCPVCGADIKIVTSDACQVLMCSNNNCETRLERKIDHFCSKNAMNIVGFSKKLIAKLIDIGLINNFLDIYTLKNHKEEILKLDKIGEVSLNKVLSQIEKSKNCELSSFLFGLGIPNVGNKMAKILSEKYDNDFNKLINTTYDELIEIKDVGEVCANSIIDYFEVDSSTRKEAEELYKMLTIQENNKLNKTINGKLSGLKIYCTGTFENYKKNELEKIVNDNGGEFTNYCKTLDLLVVGNKKGSSKVSKAKNDGIKVMTETEFISLINS